MARALRALVTEALFPSLCVSCGRETVENSQHLCAVCHRTFRPHLTSLCPLCTKEVRLSRPANCRHSPGALASISALFSYEQPQVRRFIHALKYSAVRSLALHIGEFMRHERANLRRLEASIIIPIPLHPRKLRSRGFNQALLIADELSSVLALPVIDTALVRRRGGEPQMQLARRSARAQNVRGVFALTSSENISGRTVLLVDDVVTTGATLSEAARMLREAGASRVDGLVLARD